MRQFLRALFLLLAFAASAFAQYTFVPMDFPGASLTYAMDINDHGQILGCYLDNSGTLHPFMYSGATFAPLGAQTLLRNFYTEAYRVNNRGDVVGTYYEPDGVSHGYVLDKQGGLTVLDYPGADYTIALGMNDSGVVVGWFGDLENGAMVSTHGFAWDKGVFTRIDSPDAPNNAVLGINGRGDLIGWAAQVPFSFPWHGFLLSKGHFYLLDAPVEGVIYTTPREITNNNWIVGGYAGPDFVSHGFLRKGPVFTNVDYPGSNWTHVFGINEAGQLVGVYTSDFVSFHGFFAQPAGKGKP